MVKMPNGMDPRMMAVMATSAATQMLQIAGSLLSNGTEQDKAISDACARLVVDLTTLGTGIYGAMNNVPLDVSKIGTQPVRHGLAEVVDVPDAPKEKQTHHVPLTDPQRECSCYLDALKEAGLKGRERPKFSGCDYPECRHG